MAAELGILAQLEVVHHPPQHRIGLQQHGLAVDGGVVTARVRNFLLAVIAVHHVAAAGIDEHCSRRGVARRYDNHEQQRGGDKRRGCCGNRPAPPFEHPQALAQMMHVIVHHIR
jgi:hypothetical protein